MGAVAAPPSPHPSVVAGAGNDALRVGAFGEAVEWYTKGIDAAPTSANVHVLHANRSAAFLKQGLPDRALDDAVCVRCALQQARIHACNDA